MAIFFNLLPILFLLFLFFGTPSMIVHGDDRPKNTPPPPTDVTEGGTISVRTSSDIPQSSFSSVSSAKHTKDDSYFIPDIVTHCTGPSSAYAFYSLVSSIHKEPPPPTVFTTTVSEDKEDTETSSLEDTKYATSTVVFLPITKQSSSSSPSPSPSALPSAILEKLLIQYYGSENLFVLDIVNDSNGNKLKEDVLERLGKYLQKPFHASRLPNHLYAINCDFVSTTTHPTDDLLMRMVEEDDSNENFCTTNCAGTKGTCSSPHHYQQQHIIVVKGLHKINHENILNVDIYSRLLEKESLIFGSSSSNSNSNNKHHKVSLKNVSIVSLFDIIDPFTATMLPDETSQTDVTVDGSTTMIDQNPPASRGSTRKLLDAPTLVQYVQSLWKQYFTEYQIQQQKNSNAQVYKGNVLTIGAIFNRLLNHHQIVFPFPLLTSSSVPVVETNGGHGEGHCQKLLDNHTKMGSQSQKGTENPLNNNNSISVVCAIGILIVILLFCAGNRHRKPNLSPPSNKMKK